MAIDIALPNVNTELMKATSLASIATCAFAGVVPDSQLVKFANYKLPNEEECHCKNQFIATRIRDPHEGDKLKFPLTRITKLHTDRDGKLSFRNTYAKHILDVQSLVADSTLNDPVVLVVLASANTIRKCDICRETLKKQFDMSDFWWSKAMRKMNGYFGFRSIYNEDDPDICEPKAATTWIRLMAKRCVSSRDYSWTKINLYTHTNHLTGATVIFSFDTSFELDDNSLTPNIIHPNTFPINPLSTGPTLDKQPSLESILLRNLSKHDLRHPLWMYQNITQEYLRIQEDCIWKMRNLVRNCESDYREPTHQHPSFADLNVIARHAIHIIETGKLAVTTIEKLCLVSKDLEGEWKEQSQQSSKTSQALSLWIPRRQTRARIPRSLQNRLDEIVSINMRADATYARLQAEIQLAFNVVTQADSQSMKTIAVLTMLFLPPTFIATIYGSTFFEDGTGMPNGNFVWFWIVTVPVTVVIMGFWIFWHRLKLSREAILKNMTLGDSIRHAVDGAKAKFKGQEHSAYP